MQPTLRIRRRAGTEDLPLPRYMTEHPPGARGGDWRASGARTGEDETRTHDDRVSSPRFGAIKPPIDFFDEPHQIVVRRRDDRADAGADGDDGSHGRCFVRYLLGAKRLATASRDDPP